MKSTMMINQSFVWVAVIALVGSRNSVDGFAPRLAYQRTRFPASTSSQWPLPMMFKEDTLETRKRGSVESKPDYLEPMPAQTSLTDVDPQVLVGAATTLFLIAGAGLAAFFGLSFEDFVSGAQHFFADPQLFLNDVVESVKAMGPAGPLAFGLIYFVAEMLAVPATPLTLSAGYLFGLQTGFLTVYAAAVLAACVAFVVGKLFLRTTVEGLLVENPQWAKLDKAVGKEGFKLLLLVRLSPLFPFSLSNYFYGASSIDFASFFWGTVGGFAPGTAAYVYTGMAGKALTIGGVDSQPWYVYAAGLGVLSIVLKLVTDVATEIVQAVSEEDEA